MQRPMGFSFYFPSYIRGGEPTASTIWPTKEIFWPLLLHCINFEAGHFQNNISITSLLYKSIQNNLTTTLACRGVFYVKLIVRAYIHAVTPTRTLTLRTLISTPFQSSRKQIVKMPLTVVI